MSETVQNMNPNTTGTLTQEMHTYYDLTLLDNAEPELVHGQFGQKRDIPTGGSKTIQFRRFTSLPKATEPLTEGVTPDGQSISVDEVKAEVKQYGGFVTVSDVLETTAVDNVIVETTKMIGSQAGRTLDTIDREVLNAGTNVVYAPKASGTAVTTVDGLDMTCKLTPALVFQVVNQLKRMNVKPLAGGDYVCIVHPDVTTDLMSSDAWLDLHRYADPEAIYNGEVGKLGKVRFVETSEAKIVKNAAGLAVYSCLFLGEGAYGVTQVAGEGLQLIVKQKGSAGTADPLDQRSTIGWKALHTAEILAEERMVRLECCSYYSDKVFADSNAESTGSDAAAADKE